MGFLRWVGEVRWGTRGTAGPPALLPHLIGFAVFLIKKQREGNSGQLVPSAQVAPLA